MKNKKIIQTFMSFLTILGLVSCGNNDSKVINESPVETFIEPDIVSYGMKIKRIASGIDSNDHSYQSFSYTVLPSNSLYSDVDVSISFLGGSSCVDFVTFEHDASHRVITLTCLQPFTTVINVHLEAHYNTSVYADINVHYLPKYTQDISKTLNFYKEDPQNPGNYIETTTTEAFLNAYSFDVSLNSENVLINPRTGVQIDDGSIFPYVPSDQTKFPYITGMYGGYAEPDFNEWFYSDFTGFFPNNYTHSFLTMMETTGFNIVLHELMIKAFVGSTKNSNKWMSTYSGFSNSFRSNLLEYLNSQKIDSLDFDSTHTKSDLINAINVWMSSNDFYYMYFGHVDLVYLCSDNESTLSDIQILYGNGETESFNGVASDVEHTVYGYFKAAKFIMPEPFTPQELAPSSITSEVSSINF